MKRIFSSKKSHDPPPPAASKPVPSSSKHRSASVQPELKRTRAPSVRGIPAAAQPLHRTDRPESPSRERQHGTLRSSSRARPEPPLASSSHPERAAYPNGTAHTNGSADPRARPPRTYEASILERPQPTTRTKAPSIFNVPGATTSARDDAERRERRARRHAEEVDDRERVRDKDDTDRYRKEEQRRRAREEKRRLQEEQLRVQEDRQRLQEERQQRVQEAQRQQDDRQRQQEAQERQQRLQEERRLQEAQALQQQLQEKERVDRERRRERKRAERERAEREEQERLRVEREQERLRVERQEERLRAEREQAEQEEREQQEREREERERLTRQRLARERREREKERARIQEEEREQHERERERERRDREKAREREARKERHRLREQERARLAAAAPPEAPPVAAAAPREKPRLRERVPELRHPEPPREAPNPTFLKAKLLNGQGDEGDSSDSSARRRRVAAQQRRHTEEASTSRAQPAENHPSTSHLRSSSMPQTHELLAQSSSDTDQAKRERKRRAPSVRPASRSQYREMPDSAPVRPPSRSHHREIPTSSFDAAPPPPPLATIHPNGAAFQPNGTVFHSNGLNGIDKRSSQAQEFTPSSDSRGNKKNSPQEASPSKFIRPSPPYPAYKDHSPSRAHVPIMQTRSASQQSHFPSAEHLSFSAVKGKFSPNTNPSPHSTRSRDYVKHSPSESRDTGADAAPPASYPSGYAPVPVAAPALGHEASSSSHLAPAQMLSGAGASRETLHLPTPRAVAPSFNIFSHAPPQDEATVIGYDEVSIPDPASQATWGSSNLRDSKLTTSASDMARRTSQTPRPPAPVEPISHRQLRNDLSSTESVSKPPLTAFNHAVPMRTRTVSSSDNEERKESPRGMSRKERTRREKQASAAQASSQPYAAIPPPAAAPAHVKTGAERVAFADEPGRSKQFARADLDRRRGVPQHAPPPQDTGPAWFTALQPTHGERSFDAVHGSPMRASETTGSPALPVPPPVPRLPPPPFGEDESPTVPPFETPPTEPAVLIPAVMFAPEPPEPSPPRGMAPTMSTSRERVRDSGIGFSAVPPVPAPLPVQQSASGHAHINPESIAPQRSWHSVNSYNAPPVTASASSQERVTFPTRGNTVDVPLVTARPPAVNGLAPETYATRRRSQSHDSHLFDVSWSTRGQGRADSGSLLDPPPRTATATGFRSQPRFEPPARTATAAGFRQQPPKDSPPKWTSPSTRTTVNHAKLAEILSPPPPSRRLSKVSPPQDQGQGRQMEPEPAAYPSIGRSASVAPGQERRLPPQLQQSVLFSSSAEPTRAPRDTSRVERPSPPPTPPQRRSPQEVVVQRPTPPEVEPLPERVMSPSPPKLSSTRTREAPQRPPSRAHQPTSSYPASDPYRTYNQTYPEPSAMAASNVTYKPSDLSQTRATKQASSDNPANGPPSSRRMYESAPYPSTSAYGQQSINQARAPEPPVKASAPEHSRAAEYARGMTNGATQAQPPVQAPPSRHHPSLSLPTSASAPRAPYLPPSNPSTRTERATRSQSTSSAVPPPEARQNGYSAYATYSRATGQAATDHKLRPKASEESLQTPSSIRRSPSRGSLAAFLEPEPQQQQQQYKQQDATRKNGLLSFFRQRTQDQPPQQTAASAPQVWHPAAPKEREQRSAAVASVSRDAPSDSKKILHRAPVAPSTRAAPPPPINVQIPISGPPPPAKSPKVLQSLRYLSAKRYRTVSAASHEAADGTAPNTVGSPTASMHSSTPMQPPSLRDPLLATEQWQLMEEEQQRKPRRQRPGVVFDVPEGVPENGRPRLGRQHTRAASASRSTRTPLRVQTPGPGRRSTDR